LISEVIALSQSTIFSDKEEQKAPLEVLRVQARHEEVEALSSMSGMDLSDPDVMSCAWRSERSTP
jgi:hypothetical protein